MRSFVRWTNPDGYEFPLCEKCRIARDGDPGAASRGHAVAWPVHEKATCNDCGADYLPLVLRAARLATLTGELESVCRMLIKACQEDDTASREHYLRQLAAVSFEIDQLELVA